MSYQSWSVVYGEQPSAAKWNIIGSNFEYMEAALPPVGSIMYFWGDSASVPGSYILCDGSEVSDADSPINGLTVPDLTNKFVRAVTGNVRTTPVSGGADTINIAHTHTGPAHTHTMAHTHSTPAHVHKWGYNTANSGDWYTYNSNGSSTLQIATGTSVNTPGSIGDISRDGLSYTNQSFYTQSGGSGTTGAASTSTTSSSGTGATSSSLSSSQSILPSYIGLVSIIRIK